MASRQMVASVVRKPVKESSCLGGWHAAPVETGRCAPKKVYSRRNLYDLATLFE
jgi:hypothetical protein